MEREIWWPVHLRVALLLIFTAGAWAQLAVQGPQPIYDGQNVGAIDLIGNPHRDVESFRHLIEQQSGQPYSQSKVEASIAALQSTGQFPKVEVEVVPDPSGLRLDFLLEPAYSLGMVNFPGATKLFSYTRLLQVADLHEQDSYDPARIAASEKDLQKFFQRNGYFKAATHMETQIDDARQLVNVTFTVNLAKQARIAEVSFQGTDSGETSRLLHSVRSLRARLTGGLLKPGKPYNPERVTAAAKLITQTLAAQHRLSGSVKEEPPQYHPETNRVDVSFKVEVGPLVTVQVKGAKLSVLPFLSRRQIKKLIPIYSERSVDSDLVREGEQNLIDFFQKKGYFNAQAKTTFDKQPEKISLVYEINKGTKHKVASIVFQGNHQIAEKDLAAVITVKKAHLYLWSHGSVSQKLANQSARNVEALYRDRGYEDAKVTPQIVVQNPRIEVVFIVQEGKQTLIRNVAVTGNNNIPTSQLIPAPGFQLHSGAPYSPRKLADDRNHISATYLNRGYLNAEVKAVAKRDANDPHRVEVTYNVTENQMVRVRGIIYLGQNKTRLALIEKTTKLPSEAPIRRGDLLEAESRLYDLNIFDWSSVGPKKPITD
jgi:outer membrane protein insertion porin family